MLDALADLFGWLDSLRPLAGGALCLLGGIVAVIGAAGTLRFPDFYTRLHAASVTDTGATLALLFGMALLSPHWLVLVKLAAIGFFLFISGPTSSHAIANAAHVANLEPKIGPAAGGGGAPGNGGEEA